MRFGYWAPRGGRTDESGIDDFYKYSVEVAQIAENSGFDTTLIAQRYIGMDLDAWVLASALATQTRKLELLIAIHPGILTPQLTAKMGSTLDHISNGRFAINLVNGWWEEEMTNYGNGAWLERSDARYRRMNEFVDLLKKLWTEEVVDFSGEFFSVKEGRLPLKPIQNLPPIYTASRSEIGQETVASLCEDWFISFEPGYKNFDSTLKHVAEQAKQMNERAAKYNRRINFALNANMVCAPTQEEAEREADEIEAKGIDKKDGGTSVVALGAGLVGSPQVIAERMKKYSEVGIKTFMLRFPRMLPGMQQFSREVIPLVR